MFYLKIKLCKYNTILKLSTKSRTILVIFIFIFCEGFDNCKFNFLYSFAYSIKIENFVKNDCKKVLVVFLK